MQENVQSEFMKTIKEIKSSESEAEKLKNEAREKADKILHKARENVMKIRSEMEEDAVKLKNKKLKKGTDEVEKEVKTILDGAKSSASKIRKKSLASKDITSLANDMLSSV